MTGYINEDGPIQNLTTNLRYNSMQSAIYYAHNGDEMVFAPGTYQGGINLTDKDLILRSEEPNNPSITEQTIIQGNETSPVITFNKNNTACKIAGLTITGGQIGLVLREASPRIEYCRIIENIGHGIDMQAKSDPVISNTLICTNGGTGVYMTAYIDIDFAIYNEPEFINCTIAQNAQAGIYGGRVTMRNGIVYGNGTAQLSPVSAVVSYSCIQGGYTGAGNIDADPYFVQLAYWDANDTAEDPNDDVWVAGDYHLKSQAGRFDPNSAAWVQDDVTSPCIDAGDPNDGIGNEPDSNGDIINMGAYGGTVQASRTLDGD
jgi:hypothetical protein